VGTKTKATREQIVEAADRLIYEKGFEYMAFADLADAVGISRGNVTFHFQNRDEILAAVIDLRLDQTLRILDQWEAQGQNGEERIRCFINILIMNLKKVLLYGCPVGSLCTELAKLEHAALAHAGKTFSLFRHWLTRQFLELGCGARADALAMQVLVWSQGVATLASALQDEQFVRTEVHRMEDWLQTITANERHRGKSHPLRRRKAAKDKTIKTLHDRHALQSGRRTKRS